MNVNLMNEELAKSIRNNFSPEGVKAVVAAMVAGLASPNFEANVVANGLPFEEAAAEVELFVDQLGNLLRESEQSGDWGDFDAVLS